MNSFRRFAIVAVVAALLPARVPAAAEHAAPTPRQEEVARKGATVMPFDLSRTTHIFEDRANGGNETVIANDRGDAEQIALIRSHLAAEARRFAHGDFSDPAAIHGANMPGLAVLTKAGRKLRVTYGDVPGGARVAYASEDAHVIEAVHLWFAAQRSDHAAHGSMQQMK